MTADPFRIRCVLACVLVVAGSIPTREVFAQYTDVLALDRVEYLDRVASDAPRWLTARERTEVVQAERGVARRRPNPFIEAGLAQFDVSGQGAPTASLLAVDVPIELGGDRARRLDEVDARLALNDAELDAETRQLLFGASIAYTDALAAEALVDARTRLLAGYEIVAALDA